MAAAGALGVEGVDGAALERGDRVLDEARLVQRVGVDQRPARPSRRRPTRQQSIAAGVVPQSSCSLRPQAPASICSISAVGRRRVALAERSRGSSGRPRPPAACGARCQGAGRAGRGVGAGRRAGAAAEHRGDAAVERLLDLLRADEVDVASMPPAVTILPSPAITSVPGPITMSTPGWVSGLPALPMPAMRPSRMPMSALTMPQWSRISALVMTVSTAPSARGRLRLAHAVADHLAAAELDLLAVDGAVVLDLDEQLGVGEPHPVAGGRAEHVGIGGAGDAACAHQRRSVRRRAGPSPRPLKPYTRRAPAIGARACTLAGLARLEAHRGAGRDVEPAAARRWRGRRRAPGWSRRSGSGEPTWIGRSPVLATVERRSRREPAFSAISPSCEHDTRPGSWQASVSGSARGR